MYYACVCASKCGPYAMVLEMSEKSEPSVGEAKSSFYIYHSEAPARVWEAAGATNQESAENPQCLTTKDAQTVTDALRITAVACSFAVRRSRAKGLRRPTCWQRRRSGVQTVIEWGFPEREPSSPSRTAPQPTPHQLGTGIRRSRSKDAR